MGVGIALVVVAVLEILGICFAQNLRSDVFAQKARWQYGESDTLTFTSCYPTQDCPLSMDYLYYLHLGKNSATFEESCCQIAMNYSLRVTVFILKFSGAMLAQCKSLICIRRQFIRYFR